MPRDANGVYSLPDGYQAVTGTPIQASQHNPPLEDVASALTGSLPTSGVAPMTGPLRLPDGNASQPAIAFNSDPSAGYYLSNGKIYFTKPIIQKELIGWGPLPWTRTTAPAGWVLCYGQTLSRTAYADLWVVAQAEIAAGNPMYNNGDGSTTFGILDMRGRVAAGYDVMGGVAANRLPGALGVGQGVSSVTLNEGQLPVLIKSLAGITDPIAVDTQGGTFWTTTAGHSITGGFTTGGANNIVMDNGGPAQVFSYGSFTPRGSVSFGGGAAHSIVQPTIPMNAILYAGA